MKILKPYILAISILLFTSTDIFSGPAYRGIITLFQPDGTTLQARIKGDEFAHFTTDLQGRVLKQNRDGFWCYGRFSPDGTLNSTSYIAGTNVPGRVLDEASFIPYETLNAKASSRRLHTNNPYTITTRAATNNVVKKSCIIILAEYKDEPMSNSQAAFENLINGGAGSAKKYFDDQFLGAYTFSFDVGPIVTLSQKKAYYGGNDKNGSDLRPAEAVAEACRLASQKGVDFSKYDDDNDGKVDNVFLFMAGKDEASGGGEDCIWSHSWALTYGGISLTLNGKQIDTYAISSELAYAGANKYTFTSIGTFCHEYSHTLGLVDMYDTDFEANGESDCLWGTTALMDSGNYNNLGKTPPAYNAIDRDMLGIGKCEMLTPGTYELEPISENGHYFRYDSPVKEEYYLIECRSNYAWDKYIGGSGLAIYHIDKSQNASGKSDWYGRVVTAAERWYSNEVNCNSEHQCADMIEAHPNAKNASQVFFPYDRNNSFSFVTKPAFKFWDGNMSEIAISDITKDGDKVRFTVSRTDGNTPSEAKVTNNDVFQDAAIINWKTTDESCDKEAWVEWGLSGKTPEKIRIKPYQTGKYSLTLEGLASNTAYSVRIWYEAGGIKGKETSANFTTRAVYNDGTPYIYLRRVERNDDGTFPKGALLPLRLYNAGGTKSVQWYMDGNAIMPGGNGYYEVSGSGELKAVITYENGNTEIIYKQIIVK